MQKPQITISTEERNWFDRFKYLCAIEPSAEIPTTETLCRQLYVSRATLYRRIKRISGKSLASLLKEWRLEQSYILLARNPGTKVKSAALAAGFHKASYFSKCFYEQFGIRPSMVSTFCSL
jgi:AraC-like DNA-binding protein